MLATGLVTSAGLALAGFSIAGAALFAVAAAGRNGGARREETNQVNFLFENSDLMDLSAAGRAILAVSPTRGDDLSRITASLGKRFPLLADALHRPGDLKQVMTAPADGSVLEIERQGSRLKLLLSQP